MNIVILDGYTTNPGDLNWQPIEKYGNVTVYDRTNPDELLSRAEDAEVLITNKYPLHRLDFQKMPNLKCICVLATGYNNIDTAAAKEHVIKVYNASGYSTMSVAQHVFSLLLTILNQSQKHHEAVVDLKWSRGEDFSFSLLPIRELAGKILGIYGFGNIGRQVANIGHAFGIEIISLRRRKQIEIPDWVRLVDLEFLFTKSDVISLHAPLTPKTQEIINKDTLAMMHKDSILINTARGGLVNEQDLLWALQSKQIRAAGLDVLTEEPPPKDHPLIGLANCWITPHQAWASLEARKKLIEITGANLGRYLAGDNYNRVA